MNFRGLQRFESKAVVDVQRERVETETGMDELEMRKEACRGEHVNSLANAWCAVGPTCDGSVTGIQIKARAGDIAA